MAQKFVKYSVPVELDEDMGTYAGQWVNGKPYGFGIL